MLVEVGKASKVFGPARAVRVRALTVDDCRLGFGHADGVQSVDDEGGVAVVVVVVVVVVILVGGVTLVKKNDKVDLSVYSRKSVQHWKSQCNSGIAIIQVVLYRNVFVDVTVKAEIIAVKS